MPSDMAALVEQIKINDNFLIASHLNPDGDAVGSSVGMAYVLQALGKNFRLYNVSPLPSDYDWLPLPKPFAASLAELGNFKPEACLILDCGDDHRMGNELLQAFQNNFFKLTLAVDHHSDNSHFAKYNWVDAKASATAVLVADIARALNVPLTQELGLAIYLGMVSDTGYFSYANTDSRTLRLAAEIVDLGLDVDAFSNSYENVWSMNRLKLWGRLFNEIHLTHSGRVAHATVLRQDLLELGLSSSDLTDFASWMRRIKGVRVTALFRETANGGTKVSLRSSSGINVQKVATLCGGGGHYNAAAAELDLDLAQAEQKILPLLAQAVDEAKSASV